MVDCVYNLQVCDSFTKHITLKYSFYYPFWKWAPIENMVGMVSTLVGHWPELGSSHFLAQKFVFPTLNFFYMCQDTLSPPNITRQNVVVVILKFDLGGHRLRCLQLRQVVECHINFISHSNKPTLLTILVLCIRNVIPMIYHYLSELSNYICLFPAKRSIHFSEQEDIITCLFLKW